MSPRRAPAAPEDPDALPAQATALPAAALEATPLPAAHYDRDVVAVARDLVGCLLVHDGRAGRIVETEAYHQREPSCHAHLGPTRRNGHLFGPPGRAYVYRSYGIHALVNAVCEPAGVGAAVLIRALEPVAGLAGQRAARPGRADRELASGPGRLTLALGFDLELDGSDLADGPLRVLPRPAGEPAPGLVVGPRIGITKAAELPWRFCLAGSRWISRPNPPGWPGPGAVA